MNTVQEKTALFLRARRVALAAGWTAARRSADAWRAESLRRAGRAREAAAAARLEGRRRAEVLWRWLTARRAEGLCLGAGLLLGVAAGAGGAQGIMPFAPWEPLRIALTFDDGPHPAYTGRLLDILRLNGARATFFVVGSQAERNPPLLRDILREGSELANHTYSHPPLTALTRARMLEELEGTQGLLDRAGARGERFFRPPGGRFDGRVLSAARSAGYHMVLWTALPRDHESPSAEVIRRRVLAEAEDGGVVLLHSGIDTTAEALPTLVAELRARGYRCVTVGELLAHPRPTDPSLRWLDASVPPRRSLPPALLVEARHETADRH